MKKNIPILILLIISITTLGQNSFTVPAFTKADLLQKSKNQRTAGWVLLGSGSALIIAGGIVITDAIGNDIFSDSNNFDSKTTTGTVLIVTGLAAIGGGIPLLIISHRNHKKAMALAITNENIKILQQGKWSYQSCPSLTLKFSFGGR
jgi:hypothetical protein